MKTEYREVLVKQPVYIAEDGKKFDDEEECLDHEFELLNGTFECYGRAFTKVANVDEALYANLPTAKIVENFKKVCDVLGLTDEGVNGPGLYIYSDFLGAQWVNMDDAIARLRGGES